MNRWRSVRDIAGLAGAAVFLAGAAIAITTVLAAVVGFVGLLTMIFMMRKKLNGKG